MNLWKSWNIIESETAKYFKSIFKLFNMTSIFLIKAHNIKLSKDSFTCAFLCNLSQSPVDQQTIMWARKIVNFSIYFIFSPSHKRKSFNFSIWRVCSKMCEKWKADKVHKSFSLLSQEDDESKSCNKRSENIKQQEKYVAQKREKVMTLHSMWDDDKKCLKKVFSVSIF